MINSKEIIKSTFHKVGLHVSKLSSKPISPLLHHKIDLLFDVGANIGQYALERRVAGYKGKIVSFEPLPDAHEKLCERAKSDPKWLVHDRCAVGAQTGKVEINVSANRLSSSILQMLEAHSSAAPESVYIGKATTDVITLDSVFSNYRTANEATFLKIDTQGFENEVLSGSATSLRLVRAVQLELSIVPLYQNQQLYQYFFDFFNSNNFSLWSVIPGFHDPETGQHLQFDAVFVRND